MYKIGDKVTCLSEPHLGIATIVELPGCSELFPNDYKLLFNDGEKGLTPGKDLQLVNESKLFIYDGPLGNPKPMQVKIKKLNESAVVPKYSKAGDAGLDLTATSYEFVNGRHVYGTSLAVEIPPGYVGLIFPRSSICKYDLRLTNSVGVIDSGYRGEIKFQFENDGFESEGFISATKKYSVGDRIGQLLIIEYPKIELVEVEELSTTERADGGFGHTGR